MLCKPNRQYVHVVVNHAGVLQSLSKCMTFPGVLDWNEVEVKVLQAIQGYRKHPSISISISRIGHDQFIRLQSQLFQQVRDAKLINSIGCPRCCGERDDCVWCAGTNSLCLFQVKNEIFVDEVLTHVVRGAVKPAWLPNGHYMNVTSLKEYFVTDIGAIEINFDELEECHRQVQKQTEQLHRGPSVLAKALAWFRAGKRGVA